MFATVDTLQLWVRLDGPPWQRLHTETGTRVLKTSQSTGEVLVDFVAGGNLVLESWYAPVQIHCQRPYSIAGQEFFDPFEDGSGWAAIQLSVPKVILGHSVAEYPDVRHAVHAVLGELHELAGADVDPGRVLVRRADFCRTIKLPSQELAVGLIEYLADHCHYPNRKPYHRGGETIMWGSREESFKAYSKLPELLKKHGRPPTSELDRVAGMRFNPNGTITPTGLSCRPQSAQNALRSAAEGQVRFEVTLRSKALIRRFAAAERPQGHRHGILLPHFLDAVDDGIGGSIMQPEYDKILSFAEVSSSDEVLQRLGVVYSPTRANNLYRFWEVLCTEGDRGAREHYPRRTYYRHKAALKMARIGTVGNDVEFEQKRRERTRAHQLNLLSYLDDYGEHLRSCYGDEFVENLQREAGLPVPKREAG